MLFSYELTGTCIIEPYKPSGQLSSGGDFDFLEMLFAERSGVADAPHDGAESEPEAEDG